MLFVMMWKINSSSSSSTRLLITFNLYSFVTNEVVHSEYESID